MPGPMHVYITKPVNKGLPVMARRSVTTRINHPVHIARQKMPESRQFISISPCDKTGKEKPYQQPYDIYRGIAERKPLTKHLNILLLLFADSRDRMTGKVCSVSQQQPHQVLRSQPAFPGNKFPGGIIAYFIYQCFRAICFEQVTE